MSSYRLKNGTVRTSCRANTPPLYSPPLFSPGSSSAGSSDISQYREPLSSPVRRCTGSLLSADPRRGVRQPRPHLRAGRSDPAPSLRWSAGTRAGQWFAASWQRGRLGRGSRATAAGWPPGSGRGASIRLEDLTTSIAAAATQHIEILLQTHLTHEKISFNCARIACDSGRCGGFRVGARQVPLAPTPVKSRSWNRST